MKKILLVLPALALALGLVGCGSSAIYEAGSYTGEAEGHNGPLSVTVTVSDAKIESVTVDSHEETDGLSDPALNDVPAAIVEAQGTEVDSAAGATVTSEAIKSAVSSALAEASLE